MAQNQSKNSLLNNLKKLIGLHKCLEMIDLSNIK